MGVFSTNGLASAAAVFERLMYKLFGKENGVSFFQDDILVYGENKYQHDERLQKVLSILESKGLTIELSKCKFRERSVSYLGHVICAEGVNPKPELVNAIANVPSPSSKDEVRSFLEMAEYCAKFIPNFAGKVFNIRQLLKKHVKFSWDPLCEEEFQYIKEYLENVLHLSSFDPCSDPYITVDASNTGLGAVLSKEYQW